MVPVILPRIQVIDMIMITSQCPSRVIMYPFIMLRGGCEVHCSVPEPARSATAYPYRDQITGSAWVPGGGLGVEYL
jgi:hypothetical protein